MKNLVDRFEVKCSGDLTTWFECTNIEIFQAGIPKSLLSVIADELLRWKTLEEEKKHGVKIQNAQSKTA